MSWKRRVKSRARRVWKDQGTGGGSREMMAQGERVSRHGCVGVRKLAGGSWVTARALASDFPRREPCSPWSSPFLPRPLHGYKTLTPPTSAPTVSSDLHGRREHTAPWAHGLLHIRIRAALQAEGASR